MAKQADLSPSWSRRGLLATSGLALAGGLLPERARAAPAESSRNEPARGAIRLERPLPLAEVQTPALLLDLHAFERNLARMATHAKARGVGLRPHAKTHKSPIIARRQLDLGAVGICVAKVSEAEVMVDAGIDKVLITSPVASPDKIDRVVALGRRSPGLAIVVDHADGIAALQGAAAKARVKLHVLLDLDTGTRRTGTALGAPAVELARQIDASSSLVLDGVQAYAGHVMHVSPFAEREKRSREVLERCLETRGLIERAGLEVRVFSCGGTGTFDVDPRVAGVTDLQVGSYCFMDVQYRAIGDREGEVFDAFEPSLFVLATAISQPVPELITIDAGLKAFAYEPDAKPQFRDLEGLIYHYGGDEHGIVQFTDERRPLRLGDKAQLLVSHCDPTVNLYDVYHPYRNGLVHELWPVAARGRSQ